MATKQEILDSVGKEVYITHNGLTGTSVKVKVLEAFEAIPEDLTEAVEEWEDSGTLHPLPILSVEVLSHHELLEDYICADNTMYFFDASTPDFKIKEVV